MCEEAKVSIIAFDPSWMTYDPANGKHKGSGNTSTNDPMNDSAHPSPGDKDDSDDEDADETALREALELLRDPLLPLRAHGGE